MISLALDEAKNIDSNLTFQPRKENIKSSHDESKKVSTRIKGLMVLRLSKLTKERTLSGRGKKRILVKVPVIGSNCHIVLVKE